MSELCNTCLGCQQMENPDFHGVHRCQGYVDGREPEPEQMGMEVARNESLLSQNMA